MTSLDVTVINIRKQFTKEAWIIVAFDTINTPPALYRVVLVL